MNSWFHIILKYEQNLVLRAIATELLFYLFFKTASKMFSVIEIKLK